MTEPATPETSQRRASSSAGSRKKLIWSIAITALVLALVIIGVAAFSEPARTEVADEPTLTLAEQGDQLYNEALVKLQSGETTAAIDLLKQALELDPANAAARDELDKLTETQNSNNSNNSNNGGSNTEPDPDPDPDPDPEEFLQPVDDLATLLPPPIEGFRMGTTIVTGLGIAEATLDPTPGGAYDFRVSRVLLIVHDRETANEAEEYIERSSERLFPYESKTMTVDGAEVYFGTDGGRGATATFYRGRYVFEAILSADRDPAAQLSDIGRVVAKAFPDSLD